MKRGDRVYWPVRKWKLIVVGREGRQIQCRDKFGVEVWFRESVLIPIVRVENGY